MMIVSLPDNINNKNCMSLSSQVVQKIRILLDKPVSPLSLKQIMAMIDKQVVPAEQLLLIFAGKARADLLIYVVERYAIPIVNLQQMLESIRERLLKYKLEDAVTLWALVLGKKQCQGYRREWGITTLLQQAIKTSNEQVKSNIFTLLLENCKLLWNWGEGRSIQQLVKSFCKHFIKFNIYLASSMQLLNYLILKAKETKTELINRQSRIAMLEKVMQYLNFTQNKQLFAFQNECLIAIASLLEDERYQIVDNMRLYECNKMIDLYLWRKPNREEARRTQQSFAKAKRKFEEENTAKMQIMPRQVEKQSEPILIENVIDKTNDYRLRQHLLIDRRPSSSKIQGSPSKISKFLKRGEGVGGGKSFLKMDKSPQKEKNASNLEDVIQKCFSSKFKQKDNSMDMKQLKDLKQFYEKKNSRAASRDKQQSQRAHSRKGSSDLSQSPRLISQMSTVTVASSASTLEENWQFVEISNLIDLAYQYKVAAQNY